MLDRLYVIFSHTIPVCSTLNNYHSLITVSVCMYARTADTSPTIRGARGVSSERGIAKKIIPAEKWKF